MTASGSDPAPGDVTRLLQRAQEGHSDALAGVYALVDEELRRIAAARLRAERPGHTLQPTALVNEAWMKLAGSPGASIQDRAHFLAVAARAMRQVLVDHARRRAAAKRGSRADATSWSGQGIAAHDPSGLDPEELIALDDALDRLDALDPRLRQVVELRFFVGLNDTETGDVLGVTRRTVQRDWTRARAWLYSELYREEAEESSTPSNEGRAAARD